MVERKPEELGVSGSSPLSTTKWGSSSDGAIRVERWSEKPEVIGSIPICPTTNSRKRKFFDMLAFCTCSSNGYESLELTPFKRRVGGSNPSRCTTNTVVTARISS
jgi:hypothetical protein